MTDLLEILQAINPAALTYQEWVDVGMALQHEGFSVDDWDQWSQNDNRYHPGECQKKWDTFRGADHPVTAGTIVQLAKDQGWRPSKRFAEDRALSWDDELGPDVAVVDQNWLEPSELPKPAQSDPVQELTTYLSTLFDTTDIVGYVTECWQNQDGKYLPTKGVYTRTAGELLQALSSCGGDLGAAIGDLNPASGAWIRFNPLDGKDVRNENVTDYRYALIESDVLSINQQYTLLKELELPIACLVHSGKKSLHAIVHVGASTMGEYRERVDFLYHVCEQNGLKLDRQNRNPSRLSRMPGVPRGESRQYLVGTNMGKADFSEWKEWIESQTDDLPDPEPIADIWGQLPPLSPPLIEGVLRQGHKMLLAGPSKAGKSFALIELCICIAEGIPWIGFSCAQGKVLYINLELDRPSCLHRFADVYRALGIAPDHLTNIDVWNLRGRAIPMDKLAPKLIRRALKKNYLAIIIDPIYKVITGDENSADQMAAFCNQFDRIANELSAAVIYCHHHSKGQQGQKRSMDRASGSGVFARDPDALLDLIELEVPETVQSQAKEAVTVERARTWLLRFGFSADQTSGEDLLAACRQKLPDRSYQLLMGEIEDRNKKIRQRTAWRIEGTLREFPRFDPVNLWFDYPVHRVEKTALCDAQPDGEAPAWKKNFQKSGKRQKTPKEREQERRDALETAFEACDVDGKVTVGDLAGYLGKSEDTIRRYVKSHMDFWLEDGYIGKKANRK